MHVVVAVVSSFNTFIRDSLALNASVLSMMGLRLKLSALVIVNKLRRQLKSSVDFCFKRVLFHCFLRLYLVYTLFVFGQDFFLHFEMVAYLHLVFNQVFGLRKVSDKFLALLPLQVANPRFVDHICDFKLFLLKL